MLHSSTCSGKKEHKTSKQSALLKSFEQLKTNVKLFPNKQYNLSDKVLF